MKKNISIGTVGYPLKNKDVVHGNVDVIELDNARYIPPGKKAARHIKSTLPEGLHCGVRISEYIVTTPADNTSLVGDLSRYGGFQITDETMGLWRRQVDFATGVGACALVLVTPPTVRPSVKTVTDMRRFLAEIAPCPIPIVWEPHGPWEHAQAAKFARESGMTLAVDSLKDPIPPGELVYLRFGAFSVSGTRMGLHHLNQVADAISTCDAQRVVVVFNTRRALDDAKNLKKAIAGELDALYEY